MTALSQELSRRLVDIRQAAQEDPEMCLWFRQMLQTEGYQMLLTEDVVVTMSEVMEVARAVEIANSIECRWWRT